MEERIRRFDSACAAAVHHIGRLQEQARSFLGQLSCEPREFKHRFLQCSRQLDEFMYAITDFNLEASSLETNASTKTTYHNVEPNISKHTREISSHSNTSSHSNMQRLPTKDGKSYNRRDNSGTSHTKQSYKRENWRESSLDSNGRDLNEMEGNETVEEQNEHLANTETNASTKTDTYHNVEPNISKHTREISSHSNTPSHSNMQRLPTKDDKPYKRRDNSGTSHTKQSYKRENWRESSLDFNGKDLNEMEGNETVEEQNEHLANTGCQPVGLPPQPKLDPSTHEATIVTADGDQLWIVVDDTSFFKLMEEMSNYYQNREIVDFIPKSVCAYYDEVETKHFLRALYITSEDGDPEVFLVDTGEFQPATQMRLFPLAPQFATTPPLAHLCYLADVEQTEDKKLEDRQTEFLQQYLGQRYKIKLVEDLNEDGSLLSLGVYVFLEDGTTVNERVKALDSSEPELNNNSKTSIDNESIRSVIEINKINDPTENYKIEPNENESINILNKSDENIGKDISHEENKITLVEINTHDEEIDKNTNYEENKTVTDEISDKRVNEMDLRSDEDRLKELEAIENMNLDEMRYTEYENAVEAVTGYSNRDEMDICKHYKGGEGCFKGNRCKKRHVKIHPDGWTLDRVSIHVKCPSPPLPPPGTWHKVTVTHVDDTCQLYVHFEGSEIPMSLTGLVDEMTLAAENSGPLKLVPAPGELVSAPYEGSYYRARVIAAHDTVEVFYIDYGNTATVSISGLRPLEPRWLMLPARAVPCRLAGASGAGASGAGASGAGASGASVSETLKGLALDKTMQAQIIARGLDEMTVKLIDTDGFDVGEQLAVFAGITLQPYDIEHDEQRCVLVPA